MELALATKEAKTGSALAEASRQLLLLIALGYGLSYMVPACIGFASRPANEEPRSRALHGLSFNLHAELVCESAPPRLWQRSACNLPK